VDLDGVAHEIYGLPPEEFIDARNAKAKVIAAIGDPQLAAEVRKLPKPTVVAWLANTLVRERRPEVAELIALGVQIREAHLRGARYEMRQVADRRRRLIGKLVEAASKSATEAGHSIGPQGQRLLEETLEAAVVDPESAAALEEGRLSGPLHFIGFGGLPSTESGIELPSTRERAVKTKTAPSEDDADRKKSQIAERELAEAEQALSKAKADMEAAVDAVEEARRIHDSASTRVRAAAKELRDAERDRTRTNEALQRARQDRADAERELRAAERACKRWGAT